MAYLLKDSLDGAVSQRVRSPSRPALTASDSVMAFEAVGTRTGSETVADPRSGPG
jgi:hypothetical protein